MHTEAGTPGLDGMRSIFTSVNKLVFQVCEGAFEGVEGGFHYSTHVLHIVFLCKILFFSYPVSIGYLN